MRVLHSSYSAFRRLRALAIGIMAGALLLVPAVRTPLIQAAGTVLTEQNISNTSDMSEAPQIALAGDRLGATWGERGSYSIDWSTTLVGTSWPNPGSKATDTKTWIQFPDVVVDSAGTVHILYASGDKIYHRSDPTTGGLSGAHLVGSSVSPNPVRLAIAPNGTLWAVWRDTDGTSIFYKRSTNGGLSWSNGSDGGTVASDSGNMFSPDVAVGPDNIPHVVWYIHSNATFRGEIRIADWNGSSFTKSSVTSDGGDNECCYDADPAIAISSGNTIHLAWRKLLGSAWTITYANRPAGQGWQNFTPISATDGDVKYSPAIGVDTNGTVYITFSNPPSGSQPRKVVLYSKAPGVAWDGPLSLGKGKWDSRSAVVGGNGEAHVLYQREITQDHDEIMYNRIQFASSDPVIGATPVLDGGLPATRNSMVAVSFTNVTGSPDSVRYHWDAPPTDADTWVAFTNSLIVPAPAGITTEACATHSLYTQVRKDTSLSTAAQDSEIFDIGVQASVNMLNQHLAGLPATYSLSAHDAFTGPGGNGASDGDPNYTRERSFSLSISGFADCSGLSTFNVAGSENGTIQNNFYANALALPGGIAPGPRDISVEVKDALGNANTWQKKLIYDPANTDTTGTQTNTLGLPVLDSGGSATADSAHSIVRSLSFQAISVTDNLYGQQPDLPQLPAGKQFWGVWIANSTSPTTTIDDPSLNWYPVRAPTPNTSFTVRWDIFAGLNVPYADLRNRPGDYYVFVRFLDGAGNVSTASLDKVKVTLTAGYDVPTVRLPVLVR